MVSWWKVDSLNAEDVWMETQLPQSFSYPYSFYFPFSVSPFLFLSLSHVAESYSIHGWKCFLNSSLFTVLFLAEHSSRFRGNKFHSLFPALSSFLFFWRLLRNEQERKIEQKRTWITLFSLWESAESLSSFWILKSVNLLLDRWRRGEHSELRQKRQSKDVNRIQLDSPSSYSVSRIKK